MNTKKLVDKWRNRNTNKIIMLSDLQQKQLIAKFSTLTLQPNLYLTINELRENNEDLIIKTNNIFKLLDNYDLKIKILETKVEKLEKQIKNEQLTHGQ
ncbi:hypothetical protein [Spiroplasma endosymbiont of Nebria brevicollis]|uniref:hypothetical protein n=1 Tax=Spiroplasma endosymbiont of Nebria brevicollis TaxID=3066284 RepID=UPI00313CF291